MRCWTTIIALIVAVAPAGLRESHADDPASWFPADTLIFIGNEGLDANREALSKTAMGRYLESDLGKIWTSNLGDWSRMFKTLEDETAGEVEAELLTLLADAQAGLSNSPCAIAVTKLDPTTEPPTIEMAAVVSDSNLATKIMDLVKENGSEFIEVEIEGHSFLRWQVQELGSSAYLGLVDGALLAGIGDNSVLRLIARKDLGAASLAGRAEYQTGIRRAVDDGDVISSLFVDVPRLRDIMVPLIEKEEPGAPVRQILAATGLDRFGTVTGAASVRGDRFRNGLFLGIDGEHEVSAASSIEPSQLAGIPKDTLGFWAGKLNLAKLFDRALKIVENVDEEQGKLARLRVENAIQAFTGLTANDFLSSFGSSWTIYEDPFARGIVPGFVLLMRPKNPEQLDTLCTQVTGMATALGGGEFEAKVHEYEFSGTKIRYAQFHKVPSPFAPAWALVDGELICTLHPTILANVLDARTRGDAGSIASDPDFVDARRRLNHPATSMVYVDSAQIMECLYPLIVYGQQALFGLLEVGHDPSQGDYTLLAGKLPLRREVIDGTVPTISLTSRLSDGYLLATEAVSPDSDPLIIGGAIFGVGAMGSLIGVTRQEAMVEEIIVRESQARKSDAAADAKSIQQASGLFKLDHGRYPSSVQELRKPPSGGQESYFGSPVSPGFEITVRGENLIIYMKAEAAIDGEVLFDWMWIPVEELEHRLNDE